MNARALQVGHGAGEPGWIVVSILEESLEAWRRAAMAARTYADELELRLDGLPEAWLARLGAGDADAQNELGEVLDGLGRPVLAALNDATAFGRFEGSERERVRILLGAARAGVARVDVPWSAVEAFSHELAGRPSPPKVVSLHGGGRPQGAAELTVALAPLRAHCSAGDRVKLVPNVENAEQGLRLLAAAWALPGDGVERSVFGSGPRAGFTRAFAPACGARVVYAAAPGSTGTAPGQLDAAQLRASWPERFDADTRLLGVFGRPASHSLSPRLHAAVRRELDLNAVYAWLEPDDFEAALDAAAALPGFYGASVTAPFKLEALRLASDVSELARCAGSANTLVQIPGGWAAENTDAAAVAELVRESCGRGGRVRVVGAGGAARGAAAGLLAAGFEVEVSARRVERAEQLAGEMGIEAVPLEAPILREELQALVHCTPAGGGGVPETRPAIAALDSGVMLVDAVYLEQPGSETELVAEAHASGCDVRDGRDWLCAQAQGQVRLFHGRAVEVSLLERTLQGGLKGTGSRAHIALVGLRAVGKSSVGAELAQVLGLPFVDLDEALLERARTAGLAPGASHAGEVLAVLGERAFRELEAVAGLDALMRQRPSVIATGGGAVTVAMLRTALVEHARCIWLRAPLDVLKRRLRADSAPRPALGSGSAEEELERLAAEREQHYAAVAECQVEVAEYSPLELAQRLRLELGCAPRGFG